MRLRTPTRAFIGVRRWGVDLRGSISNSEKQARAAAAVPYTVDRGFPSARRAQPASKFPNQRKTRCNRSNCSSFSKLFLDQLLNGKKDNAYWPTIFKVYNVGDQLLVPTRLSRDNIEARGASRRVAVLVKRSQAGTIQPQARCCVRLSNATRSTRHGTRIVTLASRHSIADYSSDLVVWRAARLIMSARAITLKNAGSPPRL
jgi:hypothetical protein